MISSRLLSRISRNCYSNCSKMSSHSQGSHGRAEHIVLTAQQSREPDILNAKIEKISQLSPTVKGYKLSIGCDSSFKAGQWVDFFIPGEEMVGGFSMCSAPQELETERTFDLAIKYSEWPPANWLHTKAKEGDTVGIRFGGDFHYPDRTTDSLKDHDVLLIAGGVGVNPLVSIFFHINDLYEKDSAQCKKVHLTFSSRTEEELLFKQKIEDICSTKSDRFSADFLVTQQTKKSRLDKEKIENILTTKFKSKENTICYLCGPPQMIKDMVMILQLLKVPKQNIKFELWW